jgi:molecular chaperone DnaJ
METKDLYKVLEVSKGASQDEIRRSYRRLARKYHPDANPGDEGAEERFKGIQQAYEILSNPRNAGNTTKGPATSSAAPGAGKGAQARTSRFLRPLDLFGSGFGNSATSSAAPPTAPRRGLAKRRRRNRKCQLKFKEP